MKISEVPPARSAFRISNTCTRLAESSALTGSSRISTCGSVTSARATAMRYRCPPESSPGKRSSRSGWRRACCSRKAMRSRISGPDIPPRNSRGSASVPGQGRVPLRRRPLQVQLHRFRVDGLPIMETEAGSQAEGHRVAGLIVFLALREARCRIAVLVDLRQQGIGKGGLVEAIAAALHDRVAVQDKRRRPAQDRRLPDIARGRGRIAVAGLAVQESPLPTANTATSAGATNFDLLLNRVSLQSG
jgi:hypothetical protein